MSTVSVIIPTYNAEVHITNALLTTWGQVFRPLEVIVIDDGSTDNTRNCIEEFSRGNHLLGVVSNLPDLGIECLSWLSPDLKFNLVYVKQKNAGPSKARNCGIRLSRGEYIALLDVDDSWREDKLSLQMELLNNGECDFVFTNTIHKSSDGREQFMFDPQSDLPFRVSRNTLIEPWRDLIRTNFVTTSSVLAKRICFAEGRMFNEVRRLVEDWELWLKVAENFSFGYVGEPCVTKLAVECGLSTNSLGMMESSIEVLENFIKNKFNIKSASQVEDKVVKEGLFMQYKWAGYRALLAHERKLSRKYLSNALNIKFDLKTFLYYLRSNFLL